MGVEELIEGVVDYEVPAPAMAVFRAACFVECSVSRMWQQSLFSGAEVGDPRSTPKTRQRHTACITPSQCRMSSYTLSNMCRASYASSRQCHSQTTAIEETNGCEIVPPSRHPSTARYLLSDRPLPILRVPSPVPEDGIAADIALLLGRHA